MEIILPSNSDMDFAFLVLDKFYSDNNKKTIFKPKNNKRQRKDILIIRSSSKKKDHTISFCLFVKPGEYLSYQIIFE